MIQNPNEFESISRSVMNEDNDVPQLSAVPGTENVETEASSSAGEYGQQDLKYGFEELCPVCGDKVSGYHYGLLTCESCKGFFKRTVQNKKVYSCVDNRSCHIDKSQRKRCPYCRFQKCLSVGMKLEAVRTDRMRGGRNKFGPMYKRDRALKQQAIRQQQQLLASCQMRLANGIDPFSQQSPGSVEQQDIKPDPAFLMSMANSLGYGMNGVNVNTCINLNNNPSIPQTPGTTPPSSNIPSPTVSENSPRDLRLAAPPPGSGNGNLSPSPRHLPSPPLSQGMYASSVSSQTQQQHHHHPHHHHPHHQQQQSYNNPPSMSGGGGGGGSGGGGSGGAPPPPQSVYHSFYPAVPHPSSMPLLPQLIVELKASVLDEREMKHKLLSFIDTETARGDFHEGDFSPKLLRLLCRLSDQLLFLMVEWARTSVFFRELKLSDQLLFLMVEWARTSVFFRELKVEDQMKLLQASWSEILILDLAERLTRNIWTGELILANGHKLSLNSLEELGLGDLRDKIIDISRKMKELKIDDNEYTCLKFLILLNPDVAELESQEFVESCQEKVQAVLMEYCVNFYPNVKDKFSHVLLRLPDIKLASIRAEDYLYSKHLSGDLPDQTLLMEMLHSKKK